MYERNLEPKNLHYQGQHQKPAHMATMHDLPTPNPQEVASQLPTPQLKMFGTKSMTRKKRPRSWGYVPTWSSGLLNIMGRKKNLRPWRGINIGLDDSSNWSNPRLCSLVLHSSSSFYWIESMYSLVFSLIRLGERNAPSNSEFQTRQGVSPPVIYRLVPFFSPLGANQGC